MDLISLIGNSELYTLHAHTQFCDGRAEMEDFIKEAISNKFTIFGFTPHSPIPIQSSCNMKMEDVDIYFHEVERLREKYPPIKILTGMEIDYLDDNWGPSNDYFQSIPLDFSIGSVHFIPNQDGEFVDIDGRYESFKCKMTDYFHNDIRYVVETFFSQSQNMISKGNFDVIGHFDKIKHNGGLYCPNLEQENWYINLVNDLIDSIIESGVIVEINTKAWAQHQQLFPAQAHWKRLLKSNVPIIINSDVHYPKLVNASRMSVINSLNYLRTKTN